MSSNAGAVLDQQIDVLTGFLAAFHPGDVPLSQVADLYAKAVRAEHLAGAVRLKLLARVAESDVASKSGRSTAEWIANTSGESVGKARADLDTSERLSASPLTDEALTRGDLSAAQAGAITDATAINPQAEQDLLDLAGRDSLKELKAEAERRKAERDRDAEAARARAHKARSARHWTKGAVGHLHIQGPATEVAEMAQRLGEVVDQKYRKPAPLAEREPRQAYMFDAAHQLVCTGAGTKRSRSMRRQMLVRVDLTALVNGTTGAGELCEIDGVGPIPVSEARRLLSDSNLYLVLTKGVAVGNVVHLGRGPSAAQTIAKLWERKACIVEGCDRTVNIEYDHRIPWATVKTTEIENLDGACRHCHALKTHEGYALVAGTGRRPLVPPHDPRHPDHRPAELFDDTG
ncbi:MAG: HNH endonuclease [Acidimicrobiales bacterium]